MENVGKVVGQWVNPPLHGVVILMCRFLWTKSAKAQQGEAEISVGGEGPRTPPPSASAPPMPMATVP